MEQPKSALLGHSDSFFGSRVNHLVIPFEARATVFCLFLFVCLKDTFCKQQRKIELVEFKRLSAAPGEMAQRESICYAGMKTEFGCPAPMYRAG